MEIREIKENKRDYLPLLLVGDEDEAMIDRYLDRGRLCVLEEGEALAVCVTTDEGEGVLEVKNLAVREDCRRRGFGRMMLDYVAELFRGEFTTITLGTGDSPLTVPFYERCGFVRSQVIKGFFLDNYDHEIYEGGVLLTDMVYLTKKL